MPLFYNCLEFTESLSAAQFGLVVRTLLSTLGGSNTFCAENLPQDLKIAYNFMLDGARRVIEKNNKIHKPKGDNAINGAPKYKRYGNFDPKEAFERAIERTYGKK